MYVTRTFYPFNPFIHLPIILYLKHLLDLLQ
jgi:hypothetical protein